MADDGNSSEPDTTPDEHSEDEECFFTSSEDDDNQDEYSIGVVRWDNLDTNTDAHSKLTCANCSQTFDTLTDISKHFELCTVDLDDTNKENNVGSYDSSRCRQSEPNNDFPKIGNNVTLPAADRSKLLKLFLKRTKSMKCEFCSAFINEDVMVKHLWKHTYEPRHKNPDFDMGHDSKSSQKSKVIEKNVMKCEFCNLYLKEDEMLRHLLRHTLEPCHISSDVDKHVLGTLKDFINPAKPPKIAPLPAFDVRSESEKSDVDTFADCIAEITEDAPNEENDLSKMADHVENRSVRKGEECCEISENIAFKTPRFIFSDDCYLSIVPEIAQDEIDSIGQKEQCST